MYIFCLPYNAVLCYRDAILFVVRGIKGQMCVFQYVAAG